MAGPRPLQLVSVRAGEADALFATGHGADEWEFN